MTVRGVVRYLPVVAILHFAAASAAHAKTLLATSVQATLVAQHVSPSATKIEVAQNLSTRSERPKAISLPMEFRGVWILTNKTQNQCQKTDWKGIAASGSDRLTNITPNSVEEWES